jgi:hypothetical protein
MVGRRSRWGLGIAAFFSPRMHSYCWPAIPAQARRPHRRINSTDHMKSQDERYSKANQRSSLSRYKLAGVLRWPTCEEHNNRCGRAAFLPILIHFDYRGEIKPSYPSVLDAPQRALVASSWSRDSTRGAEDQRDLQVRFAATLVGRLLGREVGAGQR